VELPKLPFVFLRLYLLGVAGLLGAGIFDGLCFVQGRQPPTSFREPGNSLLASDENT
jgi:hypothetical protein